MPQLHMPLQSGSNAVLRGDAPGLPQGLLPGDHRPGPGRDPGRGDHHRHHRRLPRRDRGGFRRHARRGGAGSGSRARSRSSTRSGRARPPRPCPIRFRRPWWPSGTSGWSRWSSRPRWPENQAAGRPDGRGAGRRRRGPQGRGDPPDVGPGQGQPAGALHPGPLDRGRPARGIGGSSPQARPRPGDVVTTVVTKAAPHYLLADDPPLEVRRTRGGDAWLARRDQPKLEPSAPAAGAARNARARQEVI